MRKRLSKKIVVLMSVLGLSLLSIPVIAYQGPGTGGYGDPTDCSFTHAYTKVCKSTKDGGASWHAYKRSTFSPTSVLGFNSNIMVSDLRGQILSTCASNTEWVAVYGWDGRVNGSGSGYKQYGPLNYPGQLVTPRGNYYDIEYNHERNAKDYGDITRSNLVNGMQLTENAAKNIYKNHEGSDLPTNRTVGYFCFNEGDVINYFTMSNASDGEHSKSSGLSSGPNTAENVVVNLEVGDSTSLVFSHNLFTSRPTSGSYYQIQKKVYIDGKNPPSPGMWIAEPEKYTIQNVSAPDYYSGSNINTTEQVTVNGRTYYTAPNRPFTDGSNRFIFRDVYGTVTFKVEGEYKFCEKIFLNDSEYSGACVLVKVGPKSSYASKSNVSNRTVAEGEEGDDDYKSTGIKDTESEVATKDIRLKKGGKAYITFSHNLYSTSADNKDTTFKIERTVNDSPGISGDFEVNTYTNPENLSSHGVGSPFDGIAQFKENDKWDNYYLASPRPYKDGKYEYSLRDFYEVTFPKDGVYNFCETVKIVVGKDSAGRDIVMEFTKACSKVIVGDVCEGDECEQPAPSSECPAGWTPASYTSSISQNNNNSASATTSVIAATKNTTLRQDWTKSNGNSESAFSSAPVWAKPGDTIDWIHCYYPGVQKLASFTTTRNNSHPEPSRLSGNSNTLKNVNFSSWGTWDNGFRVDQNNMKSSNSKSFSPYYNNGDYAIKSWKNSYTVESGRDSRAGLSLKETAVPASPAHVSVSNDGIHHWSCNSYRVCETSCNDEGSCTTTCWTEWEDCEHSNDYYPSDRAKYDSDNDAAMVKVPYNFNNTATIAITPSTNSSIPSVYSGETVTITKMDISVGARSNSVTGDSYATKVDNARIKIIAYTTNNNGDGPHNNVGGYDADLCSAIKSSIQVTHDNCNIIEDKKTDDDGDPITLNDPENDHPIGPTDTYFTGAQYNVYDVAAGEYYCVAGAVYPQTVRNNTDMSASGSDSWYISAPACVKVAKRPSFQVWGNSMYTAGNVKADPGVKRVIAGFHDFNSAYNGVSATNNKNTTIFGSWVEQALVAPKSSVSGLASGAATGYYGSNAGIFKTRTDVPLLGGSHEGNKESYCLRVPLTIPNATCGTDIGEIAGGYNSISASEPSDKSALVSRFSDNTSSNYKLDTTTGSLGSATKLTPIPKGETWVYNYNGDFRITGDIVYQIENYATLVEIPKLIIHAKNINIDCRVKRIDAVLIADGNIRTCYNSSNINNAANANQLKIFGSVITNTLTLDRSYGAASGIYDNDEQKNPTNQKNGTRGQESNYNITSGSAASVVPAEIIDYDTSLYLWGMPRADASTSGKLDITYQTELAPRY